MVMYCPSFEKAILDGSGLHQARLKFFDGELFEAVFVHIRRFHSGLSELYDKVVDR